MQPFRMWTGPKPVDVVSRFSGSARRTSAILAIVLLGLVGVGTTSPATASLEPSPLSAKPSNNPRVLGLYYDAKVALRANQLLKAVIDLRLAASIEPKNPFVLTELGIALNRSGAFSDAEDALQRARSLGAADELVLGPLFEAKLAQNENQAVLDLFADPGSANKSQLAATILRARASALQALGDSGAATSAINRSLAIRTDWDSVMTAARIALLQHSWARAEQLADQALVLSPDNVDTFIFKIALDLEAGQNAKALETAEKLVKENPTSLVARLARVKVYLAMDKTDLAKPEVNLILKQFPGMAMAIYYRSIILARHDDFAAAWSVVHVLPSEFVQADPEVALNVANMAAGAGFLDSGATILNTAVFRNPHLFDARLRLAEFRLRQNSPQYALNVLAPVQDSKDPRVSVLYAQTYLLSHRAAEAQKWIARAIELRGGELLRILGKDVALKGLNSWLQVHPDDLLVRRQLAVLTLGFGDLPSAKTQYEQLVHDHPDDALALNNLAWLVVKTDPARSLTLAQRAVKQVPTSPDYLDTLGCMQLTQSDKKGALASFQAAHRLRPEDPGISYHLALALEANGARSEAKSVLALAVSQGGFSDIENARRLLASWH